MSFKVFNKNSVIIITGEGQHGIDRKFIDGVLLTREEVDCLIRNLGDMLDALNKLNQNEKIVICLDMPDPTYVVAPGAIHMSEVRYKEFSKYEIQEFINCIPELTRWV